jgi:outer membrane receptor protein involved in Fe transport
LADNGDPSAETGRDRRWRDDAMNRSRLLGTGAVGAIVLGAMAVASPAQAQSTPAPDAQTPAPPAPAGCATEAERAANPDCAAAAQGQAAAANPTPNSAPEAGTVSNQEIVVTGSRIPRRGIETASPIQVIDSKELDARGFQTVAEALNELPTFGVPGATPVGFAQSNFGAGQSFVDFLGLGSQRTLTLVDGRRFVSGNDASIFGPTGSGGNQVDLNTIPTKLIDRVETVAAIGAPIYGSDAIAGTINIILKKNYQGFDIDAQSSVSSRGDNPDYRIRVLAGRNFAGGRGNITIAGEYDQSKGLLFTDRAVTTPDTRFNQGPTGTQQILYRDFRVPSIATTGIPVVGGAAFGLDFPLSPQQAGVLIGDPTLNFGVTDAHGNQLRFDRTGGLVPIDFGTTIGPDNGFSVFTSGGSGLSLSSVENLLTDLKRYSTNALFSFQATPDVRLFGEAWYSVSQGRNLANQPVYNTGVFGPPGSPDGSLVIPLSNPFLSPAARAAIQNAIANNPLSDQNFLGTPQNYFYLGRANVDLSPGVSTGKSRILRFVGGLDGTLHVLPGRDWRFEAYFNYGQARVSSRNPEVNEQNFLNAVNAVRDASGNIVCAPGFTNSPVATLSATCAPLDLFGNQISQAAKAYVTTIATPVSVNNQYDGVASVAGPLFGLPGGNFSFALGYEHRAEDSTFDPGVFYFGAGTGDSSQRTSYGREVPVDRVFGKYHTDEIFGELNADIVSPSNHIPLIYSLSVQTAGRYIWNSQAGGDPTYTIQGRWGLLRDIAFRAAYTRAVRAPSVTEAFNPRSSAFGFATDVCDQSLVGTGPDPATRQKNCAAAGVPANFTSLSGQRSFPTFVFGNNALQNEKSDSYTAGMVLTPRFLPGFNATVDYVDITLHNAISLFTNSQVVSSCYDATNYPNNPFCALITRDASHQLNSVGTTFFNSAELKYRGILASLYYRRQTDFLGAGSHVGLNVSYQYLAKLTTVVTAGSAPVITSGAAGYSKHKGIATLSYDNGGFSGQVQMNYIGSASVDPNAPASLYSIPRYGAFTYFDLSVAYNVGPRFTLHADVDNVFDAKPPAPFPAIGVSTGNQFTPYFTGILGTYIRVGAAVHF